MYLNKVLWSYNIYLMVYLLLIKVIFFFSIKEVFGRCCKYEKYGRDHTMCKYKRLGCKGNLIYIGINNYDVKTILKVHNKYRSKIALGQQQGQPPAANMKELKWSAELSAIAQRWADQCTFAHDKNRMTSKYYWVGQNVAITGLTVDRNRRKNFTRAIEMWYDEVTNPGFNPENIQRHVPNKAVGHYTQMVWAETDRIGCGFSYYKKETSAFFFKLYICNYGPGGNIKLLPIYEVGLPATKCYKRPSKHYKGLCGRRQGDDKAAVTVDATSDENEFRRIRQNNQLWTILTRDSQAIILKMEVCELNHLEHAKVPIQYYSVSK